MDVFDSFPFKMLEKKGGKVIDLYAICFTVGLALSILLWLFGDLIDGLDGILDGIFHPILIVSPLAVFGATGWIMRLETSFSELNILLISLLTSVIASLGMYFGVLVPASKSESSTGFSIKDLIGKSAEVIVPIPKDGYGEVLISIGNARLNRIAKSNGEKSFEMGETVLIYKIEDDVICVM